MSRVGTDAGIAEQVPGAADSLTALKDRNAFPRKRVRELTGRADAGQAGANDQDVEVGRHCSTVATVLYGLYSNAFSSTRLQMSKRRYTGVEETRQQLPSLLDDAHAGKPVVITKHGRPYAAIVPLEALPEGGPRPSMRALRGSGAGLWGDDAAAWVERLRDEW